MSKDRGDKSNSGGEEFSLEDILAEFGKESGTPKRTDHHRDMEDTIPLPVIPQKDLPPEHRAGRRKGTGNNVVRFPGRKGRPAPPPEEEPEAGAAVPAYCA